MNNNFARAFSLTIGFFSVVGMLAITTLLIAHIFLAPYFLYIRFVNAQYWYVGLNLCSIFFAGYNVTIWFRYGINWWLGKEFKLQKRLFGKVY